VREPCRRAAQRVGTHLQVDTGRRAYDRAGSGTARPRDRETTLGHAPDRGTGNTAACHRSVTELFGDLIGLIVMTSIGEDVETSTVEIPDGPKISAFSLPYFFDENDVLPATKDAA